MYDGSLDVGGAESEGSVQADEELLGAQRRRETLVHLHTHHNIILLKERNG